MASFRWNKSLPVTALLLVSASLGGCLANDPFSAPVDPGSAAATQIDAAAAKRRPYPKWSQFPAAPTVVPQPSQFAARVEEVEAAEAELARAAAAIEWTLFDTAGWAASARSLVNADYARPVSPAEAAESEAFARALRERATPPPVAK